MVWHGLAWTLILALWGVWSLLCWLARLVVGWDGWRQGADWAAHVPELPLPDWLSAWLGLEWVQRLRDALVAWGPELQGWMQSWPDLSGIATGVLGLVWALGTVLLVLLGVGLSGVIVLVRRSRAPSLQVG